MHICREKVQKLLDGGQLEIVTGGWVMNDEANSHYFAITEQLMAGHEWYEVLIHFFRLNLFIPCFLGVTSISMD